MRIAYLVSQYPAINHTFILREIRRLRESGFTIRVISVRPPDRAAREMTADELNELRYTHALLPIGITTMAKAAIATILSHPAGFCRGLTLGFQLGRGAPRQTIAHLTYFGEAVIAGRWMIEEGYEHFHVHFSSTVGLLITTIFPLTMSMTLHGPDEFTDPEGFHLARKVNAATFICAISHFARSQIMRFSHASQWNKIEVARLGVDTSLYAPRAFRTHSACAELLFVGRLAQVKAPHILLGMVHRLVTKGYRLRLRVVGDGPERFRLEAEAKRLEILTSVVFEGWKNQEDVRALYEVTDIFVLPSFAEGVPVVLMEAMAKGIPCVASWVAGIPELITDGVHGLLVAPSDEEGLASAVQRLLDDPKLRRSLGDAGRARVVEQYNLNINVERMAAIVRQRLGTQLASVSIARDEYSVPPDSSCVG